MQIQTIRLTVYAYYMKHYYKSKSFSYVPKSYTFITCTYPYRSHVSVKCSSWSSHQYKKIQEHPSIEDTRLGLIQIFQDYIHEDRILDNSTQNIYLYQYLKLCNSSISISHSIDTLTLSLYIEAISFPFEIPLN